MYSLAGSDVYVTSVLVASVFTIAILVINILGIKAASIFQTILTIVIAAVGIMLVVMSAINGSPSNLKDHVFGGEDIIVLGAIVRRVIIA